MIQLQTDFPYQIQDFCIIKFGGDVLLDIANEHKGLVCAYSDWLRRPELAMLKRLLLIGVY